MKNLVSSLQSDMYDVPLFMQKKKKRKMTEEIMTATEKRMQLPSHTSPSDPIQPDLFTAIHSIFFLDP